MKTKKKKFCTCKRCGREIKGSKYTRGVNFVYHDRCYKQKWGYHHE